MLSTFSCSKRWPKDQKNEKCAISAHAKPTVDMAAATLKKACRGVEQMARWFFALRSLFILFLMRGIRFLCKVAHKMCALCKFSLLGALRSSAAVEFFLSRTAAELFSHEMLTKFFELQPWWVSKNGHESFWASVMVGFRERSLNFF